MGFLEKIFGTYSEREVKKLQIIADKIEIIESLKRELQTKDELIASLRRELAHRPYSRNIDDSPTLASETFLMEAAM